MKLGTQPVNSHGPTTFASGTPTVLPTNPNSPFAKLVAKNEVGQIVQQWLLLQNKCTLGSASSCALRCQLTGIAPYHALLVMGARQVFIRALAPKLARNGVMVNELLLTEDESTFEIAGHQFELIRNLKPSEPAAADNPAQNKMKFTLARPMEIGQVRQPTFIPTQPAPQVTANASTAKPIAAKPTASQAAAQNPAVEQLQPLQAKADSSELQPQWITDLIQSAMLPLERQLSEIIEPLAAVQNELDKRAKLERKRRNRLAKRDASEQTQAAIRTENQTAARAAEQFAREQAERERLAREQFEREQFEREQFEREQNAVNAAFTTQIDVQPQLSNIPEPLIVPIISPEVEAQLTRQSETLDNLNARLTEVKSNLGSLERIVSENFTTVIDAASAPTPTPEPVSQALERITSVADQLKISVADQLKGLTTQLDDVRSNLGSLQQTVSENLASTNELRSAPAPASQEALQRLTEVANQLSQLLQDMNARQISAEQSEFAWREQLRAQEDSELAWREQIQSHKDSDLAWREQLKTQFSELRDSIAATESSILNATESSIEKATLSAQTAILTATEAAIQKASELRAPAPKGTCPTSAALLANGHLHPTVESRPAKRTPIQIAPTPVASAPVPIANVAAPVAAALPATFSPTLASAASISAAPTSAAQFIEQQITAPPSSPASNFVSTGFETSEPAQHETVPPNFAAKGTFAEAIEETQASASIAAIEPEQATESELPANQFSQYDWNPEPTEGSGYAFVAEQSIASESTFFESAWAAPAASSAEPTVDYSSSSANFIEETIEEVPMVEEASSSALPSWWTEDDKTQFKDDSSASAALSSAWNISQIADIASANPASASSGGLNSYSEGFARAAETTDYQAASAWDVEVKYANEAVPQQAPTNLPQSAITDEAAAFGAPRSDLEDQSSPSSDESFELSSLLERFGIAREPAATENRDSRTDRRYPARRESEEIGEELPFGAAPISASQPQPSGAVTIDQTEVVRAQPASIEPASIEPATVEPASFAEETIEQEVEPEPTPAVSSQTSFEPSASSSAESGEEESIEDYMKRLMARMRGGSLEDEPKPAPAPAVSVAPAPTQPADSMSSSKLPLPGAATERASVSTTGPFNPEEYVPKALAPEKTRNMAAMRELANTSARSAIQVSARRRYGTAIALKLAIALIGLGVGITLVMINGLNVNIGLIATVASFLVALIWGFDAFSTLKPLLYAAVETLENAPATAEAKEESQVY
ncbi:MAG: hypothetical protein SFV81_13470 [Pirellulaceae bacterium]|nr:hypothetical protein [Pirellulaceae bacterium]